MTTFDDLVAKLRETARSRTTIHYGDIAPMLNLDMEDPQDRIRIGEILGEISKGEHADGRPLVSVVVTHKEDERPGPGFFNLGKELGLVGVMDAELFFVTELKKAHDYWATHQ